ncbi:MAG TPA: zinc ribbon domain-containing protein [Thermomicrobiales bacterium]|nr:zinc ribbon domain-containing protein [Thermomicrobiales bacterium]
MTGAGPVQCPHCGTFMDENARFCPGCGTPRTSVREQLEREAAATGVPYATVLERARTSGSPVTAAPPGGWATSAPVARPQQEQGRGRLWLVLGIIGGILLLVCAGCAVAGVVLMNRFDVNLGDSPEGDAARHQLQLAGAGRFEERWDLLHPDQQIAVPLELFTQCAEFDDVGSIEILGSFRDDDTFVPRAGIVDTRVVIFTYSDGGSTETDAVSMVKVDGEWRWTMTSDQIADYQAGRCP